MRRSTVLAPLLPLLALVACGDDPVASNPDATAGNDATASDAAGSAARHRSVTARGPRRKLRAAVGARGERDGTQ